MPRELHQLRRSVQQYHKEELLIQQLISHLHNNYGGLDFISKSGGGKCEIVKMSRLAAGSRSFVCLFGVQTKVVSQQTVQDFELSEASSSDSEEAMYNQQQHTKRWEFWVGQVELPGL